MTSIPVFPNYTQMKQSLPLRAWDALRVLSLLAALALIVTLLAAPDTGLKLWWGLAVPLLPAVFFLAPGIWRNLCPIAALNQTPRRFGFTRGLTIPTWLKEYGFVIGVAIFFVAVISRRSLFNDSGPATAALLLAVLGLAFVGGLVFKGKSGWCSSGVCPLFAVQRVYGQTPFVTVPNSHCQTCVGCAKNCYDFNPSVAYLADLNDEDRRWSGYRKAFVGAFPGLIIAFYTVPDPDEIGLGMIYARIAAALLASAGLFFILELLLKVSVSKLTSLFGAAAISLYYYYTIPRVVDTWDLNLADATVWVLRIGVVALAAVWWGRTYLKEQRFAARAAGPAAPAARPGAALAGASVALKRARGLGQPEVTFMPDDRRVVVEPGRSLLEIAEANNQKIEAGCRMGVCGADPIAVLTGMDNLAPVSDDERNTLERLGLASNTRMACVSTVHGDVALSLRPERPAAFTSSVIRGFKRDPSVERVVIIGNGIAGVTAADHVRRRHPICEIHLVAKERHHLYNRMAIERLIYGRSAMQGLYLQEEKWYEDLNITTWLNTRATGIDREAHEVVLGTGERLPYDRLILAMGSSSMVPPIEGFGMPGTFVMREADDAQAIRAYAQQHGCRHGVIAGGGLLGLEAAYALHKLGLRVAVLERSEWLLRRQLDATGGRYLKDYLEGLGIEIITTADTAAVQGTGRAQQVVLKDGRTLPCDLFLVAAGITPNVELAREAGLTVNRGVVVDDLLRTSDPQIFAVGDVAEHRGQVYGLWPAAGEQGQVAAANAVGGDTAYEGTVAVTILKVVGVELTSIGRFEAASEDDIVIALEAEAEHRYRKLVIADGQIAGAILFGYPLLSNVVSGAIKQAVDVTPCLAALRAGDWEVLSTLSPGPPRAEPAVAARRVTTRAAPPEGWQHAPPAPPVPATPTTPAPAVEAPKRSEQAGLIAIPGGPQQPPAPAPAPEPVRVEIPRRTGPLVRLQAEGGPVDGSVFDVDEQGATLGRTAENAIYIADSRLSRLHARIALRDAAFWLTDENSTNGTFVNYARVTAPHRLQSGDVIGMGTTRLNVTLIESS